MTIISLEGQTLGKYRVMEPLGRGGMAQVYRGFHPQLNRYVAVKVLRSDLVEEAEFLARFQREAQAVAGLRHPNIVQVHDFDTQHGLYYMIMELLDGDTLKAHLNKHRTRSQRMPTGEIARILSDVLAGLEFAHIQGIVHRDIKPANIMLSRQGQAVLTDFGIAQIVGGTQYTVSGALMGTLHYMAPEQGLEGHCDKRSDIYSLGIVLYEMLTGKPPFDADTPLAILLKHVNDPLPLPRKLNPQIPESIERVVLKALAKSPDDRYQSAEEMAAELQVAVQEADISIPAALAPLTSLEMDISGEQVEVFSGQERQKITNAGFARDDTDITLGQRLKAAQESEPKVGQKEQAGPVANDGAVEEQPFQPLSPQERKKKVLSALLVPIGALALVNILVGILEGALKSADVFGHAWPMEILMTGLGFGLLTMVLANPWMLIPTGLILGNGVILSYYAITGNWGHWAFLWPLEPALVAVVIALAARFASQGERGRQATRRLGSSLSVAAAIALPVVIFLAVAVALIRGSLGG
ncbi:protein kinase [Chloroflexota bacterium]